MYGLSKKQKLEIVLEKIKELEISSYEIGKKTGLSIAGIDKLLSGIVKNPHESTLNTILEFLESKVLGSNIIENNTHFLSEPKENYIFEKEKNYNKELIECQKETAELYRHVVYLQNLLRSNNIEFKDYFEKENSLNK